jgi:hypothetical protein
VALVERHVITCPKGRVLEGLVVEGVAAQQVVVEVALQVCVCVCKMLKMKELYTFVITLCLLFCFYGKLHYFHGIYLKDVETSGHGLFLHTSPAFS